MDAMGKKNKKIKNLRALVWEISPKQVGKLTGGGVIKIAVEAC